MFKSRRLLKLAASQGSLACGTSARGTPTQSPSACGTGIYQGVRNTRELANSFRAAGCSLFVIAASPLSAQLCHQGKLQGTVLDPNGSALVNAAVQQNGGTSIRTDAIGRFTLLCGTAAEGKLTISAKGFDTKQVTYRLSDQTLLIVLPLAGVYTVVEVRDDGGGPQTGGAGLALSAEDLKRMADDPDDLKKQLQVMATIAGGAPGQATITVDGFQNAGSLPPKSSIASIRVAPDMFSAEYSSPPYTGGRIEILTKPGLNTIHGAAFYTNSNGAFNATNPFSTSSTPAGKQRYGFEVSGPLVRNRLDTVAALERRDIRDFSVVNAVVLNADNVRQNLRQTIEVPQQLWVGSLRGDLLITKKDTFTASYVASSNTAQNQGIGGLVLPQAGFDSTASEYDLRVGNSQTIGATVLHQSRFGLSWKSSGQNPLSTAPGVSVTGFFQSGGSSAQQRRMKDFDLEVGESVLIDRGRHSLNAGLQAFGYFVRNSVPDYFNGNYLFGGGSAAQLDSTGKPTTATTTIDALEQYRRASSNLSGGTPTLFQTTRGTADVDFNQWQVAVFAQDTIRLPHRLSIATGIRYAMQTAPVSMGNFSPRLGVSWAPDRRSRWVLHARAGLFSVPIGIAIAGEAYRMNGSLQIGQLTYSPSYPGVVSTTAPVTVTTVRQFSTHPGQTHSVQTQLGVEHDLPKHWNVQASLFHADTWNDLRTININAPLLRTSGDGTAPDPNAALLAPRPLGPNTNILRYQNNAHMRGNIFFAGVSQHGYKRFGLFLGYLHMDLKTDAGSAAVEPQSTYTKAGEEARPDWQASHRIFLIGNLSLPYKLDLSTVTDAASGTPFNITTGTDNNGDGNFNDRPSFARAPGTGTYGTRYGLISVNTLNGDVPRNFGTLPWVAHVDVNLARIISLGDKTSRSRSLTLNVRAANVLNHTNTIAVGTVVSSPNFAQPIMAEPPRRCEMGVRFNF